MALVHYPEECNYIEKESWVATENRMLTYLLALVYEFLIYLYIVDQTH